MRAKLDTKHVKQNALAIAWRRVSFNLIKDKNYHSSAEIQQFNQYISQIKHEVRDAVLNEYLLRCNMRQCIAFTQWRLAECKKKSEGTPHHKQHEE